MGSALSKENLKELAPLQHDSAQNISITFCPAKTDVFKHVCSPYNYARLAIKSRPCLQQLKPYIY
jgi:hypothetical protein